MKETCRICARELCGNQRRWIFHTAAKLNLQVLLSHVLGRELCRDGKSEFVCSKCAFMLDRIYRFDTVIARIEALSIERLQKLLLEKDRLKFCISSMYRRNNEDPGADDRAGDGTVDLSNLPDLRYTALLQEDFAYSGYEYWAEQEEHGLEPHSCHAAEGAGNRPRRCRGCAALRVADADYEAICKVPRKVARSISCGLSSRWSTSIGNEGSSGCDTAEFTSARGPVDGESMEEGTPASSVESLDTTVEASPLQQKDEDADKGLKGSGKYDDFSDDRMTPSSSQSGNRLELALSLIKALDYKPLQSPRGSRLPIPVKSSLPPPKLRRDLADGSASAASMGAGSAFLNTDRKSFSRALLSLSPEISELQELWDDICEDYMPLRVQNLQDEHQQPAPGDPAVGEHVSNLCAAELQGKIQQSEAANKLLQEKLNELNFELKSAQETSQRQDHTIQSLNEALKSKESKTEELFRIIEGQNETMAKLQDMLQRSHQGQLQMAESTLSPQEQQQMSPLDLQNTLFCTKLEVQKLKRAQRQKDHQLAEARRATQHLETMVHEEEQQKKATWKHNQELRAVVQQLQAELQDKAQQLQTLEWEKSRELQAQEQRVQRLSQLLARKEQLLQESRELLQCQQSLDKSPAAMNVMLEKLQQRVSDRDAALERAVDEKFFALEKKEQELQQLHLSIRERGCDLERLRNVLSSNEATIHSLESLLKAKTLELEQVSATCQNLHWLKEEMEAKSRSRQKEQEGIIQQLQTCLHDRNKEVEELTATLLCKLGPGQREVTEELCLRLQQKEKMLQDLLSDRNHQTMEHDAEIRELLQAMSTKEQQSQMAAEKMAHALAERSSELQLLRQHMLGREPVGTQSAGARLLKEDKQPIQEILQRASGAAAISRPPQVDSSCRTEGISTSAAELEKDLVNAKEELELMTKKERESRRELAALQAVVATQEEELQVQASDIESLTRTIQIKEDLIKDLQMQLVDPEEIPAVERLTQEVLVLREKVAIAESQGQEATGNRRQQLLLMLEGLVAERNRLNEALQAERQLYGSLVKFHTHPDSAARDRTLQVALEGAQELRGQLEEALARSLERLSRLETQGDTGGQATGSDADDTSTNSIKEEAAHGLATQQSSPQAPKENRSTERTLMESTAPAVPGRELRAEAELRELKAQLEEAGFSSVSHIRKAMLSLYLENAELKERMGEATSLLESGEQEEAWLGSPPAPEPCRLQRKSHNALEDRPAGGSGGGQGVLAERGAVPAKRPALEARSQDDTPKRPCPGTLGGGDGSHAKDTAGVGGWLGLGTAELHSQVVQGQRHCRELQDKLAASEAVVRAQAEKLEKYHVLLREPHAQQLSKQVQVDIQDLGYETCARSETEADRDETTSPECEEPDVFSEPSLGEESGSLYKPGMPRVGKAARKTMTPEDVGALHQHIQDLKAQLLNANKVIQNLQRRARSISLTSGYTSGAERAPLGPTALTSPSHSLTDEDEGWQSDGRGTLCPPTPRAHRDLQHLLHRVALLEAQLPASKRGGILPKELQSATWPGKYDSLIQAQARELSHLRQTLREGRGVSRNLTRHLRDALQSFEDLLRGTDIDYYLGQGFREQLAQGRQLAERLSDKLGTRDRQDGEDKTSHELLALRLSRELQEKEKVIKTLEAKLQERCDSPGSSCPPSESSCSATSTSFVSEGLEPFSDGDVASECSQCHEEPAQPTGLHFDSLPKPVSAPLPVLPPFLPARPPPPVAAPLLGCCRTPVCSLAEAQQELQVLQRQLGESERVPPAWGVTLPVAPAKPTASLGPFGEGSKAPGSLCPHSTLQSLAKIPGATKPHALWDVPPPGQMLYGALPLGYPSSQKLTGADLLEEHLVEIRSLRQRLEESICTNDRLREQLERRLTPPGKGCGLPSDVYAQGSEPGLQVSSENQALREDNRTLRLQCDHISQELARVQEALLSACSRVREAEAELCQRRGEQRRLREELAEHQESIRQLREERHSLQEDNNRLQHTVTLMQQQCEEHHLLLQTLRAELNVYESLPGPSAETHAEPAVRKSEGPTGPHIIGRLDTYRALEQHVLEGKALAHELMCLTRPALGLSSCQLPGKEVKCGQDRAGGSQGSDPAPWTVPKVSPELSISPGPRRAGEQQVEAAARAALQCGAGQGESLGAAGCGCPGSTRSCTLLPQTLGWAGAGHLWGSASALHRILEQCASLLTAFWGTVLPASPAKHQGKEQALRGEIAALRAQLSERENALQSTARLKDSMEQFIVSQLTRTHNVLCKARTNLEVKAHQQVLPVA
ncbi:myomegalin isoform X3 [Heliangelus exortis]|uniref:myomegalin isoform X3 n=1 Tax=Heliangelus exortis TaxID=472823 RepID=UPI003A8D9AE1